MNGTQSPPQPTSLERFLVSVSLGAPHAIGEGFKVAQFVTSSGTRKAQIKYDWPRIKLYCPNDDCISNEPTTWKLDSLMGAYGDGSDQVTLGSGLYLEPRYVCMACDASRKQFFIRASIPKPKVADAVSLTIVCTKVGEDPGFVPQYSKQMLRRIPDAQRAHFYSGIVCENLGRGLGACVYYRRIVEDLKADWLRTLMEEAKELGAEAAAVADLLALAGDSNSFSNAVDKAKTLINELTYARCCEDLLLLHGITSANMHGGSDSEALELAEHIRTTLIDFLTRIRELHEDKQRNEKSRRVLREHMAKGKPS